MDNQPEQVKLREPVFTFPKLKEEDYPDWFKANKEGIARGFCIFPDIRFGRMMAISMLKETWNREVFLDENRGSTEIDRMCTIAYIQYLASHSGLLSYDEIKKIQNGITVRNTIAPTLKAFDQVALEAKKRKASGQTIGLLSGSFDPFTITHASLQLMGRNYCDYLILGFDNDEHIKLRKGELRKNRGEKAPRYGIKQRRMFAEGLAVTDATVALHPIEISEEAYKQEYLDLGVDILFVGETNHPALPRMTKTMDELGGKVHILFGDQFLHSTDIVDGAKDSELPIDYIISEEAAFMHSSDLTDFLKVNGIYNLELNQEG